MSIKNKKINFLRIGNTKENWCQNYYILYDTNKIFNISKHIFFFFCTTWKCVCVTQYNWLLFNIVE